MANSTGDGIHYGLQDLVIVPMVVAFAQGLRTAAEYVLQGPPFRQRVQPGDSTKSPAEQVRWVQASR